MKQLNEFLIPFIGLKVGKHSFEYNINNTFFDLFDYSDFESSTIKVNAILEKKSAFMELSLKHKGTILVPCDTTGEMFDMPIKGKIKIVGLVETSVFYLNFSKSHKDGQRMADIFEKGMKKIKSNGVYSHIETEFKLKNGLVRSDKK